MRVAVAVLRGRWVGTHMQSLFRLLARFRRPRPQHNAAQIRAAQEKIKTSSSQGLKLKRSAFRMGNVVVRVYLVVQFLKRSCQKESVFSTSLLDWWSGEWVDLNMLWIIFLCLLSARDSVGILIVARWTKNNSNCWRKALATFETQVLSWEQDWSWRLQSCSQENFLMGTGCA